MRATRIAGAILALSLALALVGCKGEEKKGDEKKTAKPAKVKQEKIEGVEAEASGSEGSSGPAAAPKDATEAPIKPVLLESRALEMIPGSALMVAATAGIEPLADRIGWSELRTVKRDWYEMAVAMLVQFLGHNILDFANLPEIGVDPNAPMGFAWLSWEGEAFAAWVQLTDPEKFKLTLYKVAGLAKEEVTPETMGEALILSFRGEDEVKIVLRGDFAFLVFSDDGEREAMNFARRVASTDRAGSILEVEAFKSLMGSLESGRDGALYLDVGALVNNAFPDRNVEAKVKVPEKSWARRELDEAKARSAPQDEIDRLTKALEEELKWQNQFKERQKAERELMRSLWGALGSVAVGAGLGQNSVNAHAVASVNGGMIIELFGRSEGSPLITRVVSDTPWLLAGATVDTATYQTLFEQLLAADGTDWDAVEKKFGELAGGAAIKDLLRALDGQVGFYVGGRIQAQATPKEAFKDLTAGGYLGIKNAEKVTALLETMAAHPKLAELVKADGEGWAVEVPEWRTVYVQMVDGYLAAATDKDFIQRVAKGGGGDWPGSLKNKDLAELFTSSKANAAWMMDMGLVGYMTFARFHDSMQAELSLPAGHEDVPFSQTWTDKKKELDTLQEGIKEAGARLEKEEYEVLEAMFRAIGVTAAVGGPGDQGLQVRGGQYFGLETFPAVGKEIAKRAFQMEALSSRRRTEVWDRQNGIWRLREELQRLRTEEIEAHMKKAAEEATAPPPTKAPVDTPIEIVPTPAAGK